MRQVALNLALKHVAAILIEGIPLIECQDHRTTRINHSLHDTHILLRDRLGNIQQHHGNLRTLQSSLSTQRRVELRTLSHVLATANTRGIHKTPGVAAQLNNLVNRVTSRTGQVVHHGTLRTSQLVQQRRLTHVRATHQSHTTRATQRLRLSELRVLRHDLKNLVQSIRQATAVQTRHRERLTHTQRPEVINLRLQVSVVNLISNQNDRLLHAAQHTHNLLVRSGHTHAGIHHQDHNIGLLHSNLSLLSNLSINTASVRLPTTGINQGEALTQPLSLIGHAVTSHTRLILNHRFTAAQNTVNDGRLTHVRAANNRHYRISELLFLFLNVEAPSTQQGAVLFIQVVVLKTLKKSLSTLVSGLIINLSEALGNVVLATAQVLIFVIVADSVLSHAHSFLYPPPRPTQGSARERGSTSSRERMHHSPSVSAGPSPRASPSTGHSQR